MQKRIAALDVLRGTSILLVMIGHFFGLHWGWIGVDIFFCLSGFLITRSLLEEKRHKHYWKLFYIRRATRIFPPYLLLLIFATACFSIPWHHIWFYYALSIQNYVSVGPYEQDITPINILWSLAIEEQFYLVWPFLVRKLNSKLLITVLIAILLIEPLLRWHNSPFSDIWRMYYLTPYRIDGLAAGSLLSVLLSYDRFREQWAKPFGVSLVLIGSAVIAYGVEARHWSQFTNSKDCNAFLYSCLAITFSGLISLAVVSTEQFRTPLVLQPLSFLGLISYGLYLYHAPIQHLTRRVALHLHYTHAARVGLIAFPLSVLVAYVSYRVIELPILNFGRARAKALKAH